MASLEPPPHRRRGLPVISGFRKGSSSAEKSAQDMPQAAVERHNSKTQICSKDIVLGIWYARHAYKMEKSWNVLLLSFSIRLLDAFVKA